eukprot:1988511-Pyramimonas_sp.AAC.1
MMSVDWQWSIEAKVRVAVDDMRAQHSDCLKGITGVTSPVQYRSITTARAFKAGEIVLVLLTESIALKKPNEDSPNGGACVKSYKGLKGTNFNIVLPPTGGMKMPGVQANTGVWGAGKGPWLLNHSMLVRAGAGTETQCKHEGRDHEVRCDT